MPTPLGRFEVAMLEFIVANRRDTGIGSAGAFDQMREAIVAGGIPSHRALDACTQAVVWFLKRREISRELFEWYARLGHSLVHQDSQLGSAAVSAWYRAVAMSPAARGDAATTRRFMERARAAADQTVASRQYPYELHLVKTYHESSIKEHMYVTCDIDRAVASAEELIAMDPIWAPSHGELGDVYMRFGQPERAAQEYDRAAELGPPYYGHHILQAARAYAAAGEVDVAIARYRRLAELVPDDAKLLAAALRLAHSHSREDQAYFERALDRLEKSAASVGPAS
jgi:tetratricopeptide (TPR) repeat protein